MVHDDAKVLAKAIAIAATKHVNQFDKGGKPYIQHPLKVMYWLKTDDFLRMAIAVLHDVVEDTKTTYQELRAEGMPERVIEGVRCLTKQAGQTDEEYEQQVLSNVDAIYVKASDLRHNSDLRRIKGVGEKDFQRVQRYMKFYERLKLRVVELEAK